ncbi:alkylhydroperoxidase AhpD family core domain-containing protein [Actinopolyspora lacussalsi subsp. righensis]|uniref:Alkylhydroperoxidase AhpD family core domain-containing protein n=1 Tax=Actinopolyspora righensis TaxID=995060 RepID=A0A1I6Z8F8_9ACTN|nr:carboxymuconolactone decarboxylase family protein [Actinopolyspora righensis]SFT58995.1 alkylhydroperoxidase AhpD family core domain-containing protein [Actinopolyspora righensis]
MTEQRMNLAEATPEVYRAMRNLEQSIQEELKRTGVEKEIYELVKIRASQLNGCAFCLDMHLSDSRELGISQQRLDVLPAWREVELYSERERAALELAEAVTLVSESHVDDEVWQRVRETFSEAEAAVLTWAATGINSWNRLAITSRAQPPRRSRAEGAD